MKKYPKIGRILAMVLIFAMLLPCIGMTAFSQENPCAENGCLGRYRNGICTASGHLEAAPSESGVYRISNAGQLYWFAALVNGGSSNSNAVLTADITINENFEDPMAWIPIGLYTGANEQVRYSGTFDGAGYTLYGVYYDNTAYHGRNAGLFGTLDAGGVVKNLTLADSYINGATDIGGIVSHNYGAVIGCTNAGTVTGTGATGGIVCRNLDGGRVEACQNTGAVTGSTTGGIAAENMGTITGCTNSGVISGTNSVGGIAGINEGAVENAMNSADVNGSGTHVGGVVGNHIGGGITGCGNSGAVTGGSDYIGGVAGVCSGAEIHRSFNTGAITGAEKSDAVGGVTGAIDGTNTAKSTLVSCYNQGTVTGRSWVGGIAGISGYQKTPQTVEIRSSYSSGAVSGTAYDGAVVGRLTKGTVSDVYYLSGGENTVSGASAATAAQFASGEIAYKLNGSTDQGELVWKQTLGTDAYPSFEGAVVSFDSEKGTYYNAAPVNPFTDVPEGSFYYDPVLWAVGKGITTGATETTFNPDGKCQRAAVVTFLWRAAGSPEPTSTHNPFTDVPTDAFYYKAVLWAVEEGITNGLTATTFGPFAECNRAQVVTFLWRSQGCPGVASTEHPFTDVVAGSFYEVPVLWAVENGITNGLTATTFGPTAVCNRAQVVTFLYRTLA